MPIPTDNETWLIYEGDRIIQKKADSGIDALSPLERLIYCLWVVDYSMRNAGDLATAQDLHPVYRSEAQSIATLLGLTQSQSIFVLDDAKYEEAYFDRFESLCDELRAYTD